MRIIQPILFLHIAGGVLAVASGYAALFAPKGKWLHRRAGVLFVWAMVAMGVGAAIVGLARDKVTWLGGMVVIYYVLTGLRAVRRSTPTRTDLALTAFGVAIAATSLLLTVRYTISPTAESMKIPSPLALLTPTMLSIALSGDLRERRFGPLSKNQRVGRHLWRLCYAMFVATSSFFLGQARVIPQPLRIWPVLLVLALLPLPVMFYWMGRVRSLPSRFEQSATALGRLPAGAASTSSQSAV
jgi:uncharacterized membrane protein